MRRGLLIPILAVLIAAPCAWSQQGPGPARAQRRAGPPPRVLERLERMTPEQRQRILDRLPPGRRANVERKLRQYESLPPEQRAEVRENFDRFRNLPPERQQAARELFNRLQQMPRDRRLAVREQFRTLRQMRLADRQAHLDSADYRTQFTPDERRWVQDALETMRPAAR